MQLKVGLLNDSFPPTIDGVANTVLNYAESITKNHGEALVVTPKYPHVVDNYPFEVYRYRSIPIVGPLGYRAGNPFSARPFPLRLLGAGPPAHPSKKIPGAGCADLPYQI